MLSRYESQILQDIFLCMESVCEVIGDLSGDTYPSCSMTIPALSCTIGVVNQMKPVTTEGQHFKKLVIQKSGKKLRRFENSTLCSVSTILDPRFKRANFKDIGCASKKTMFINNLLQDPTTKNISPDKPKEIQQNKSKIWAFHASLDNQAESHFLTKSSLNVELKQFIDQKRIEIENCAIRFWKSMSLTFRLLHKYGIKFTSLIGSSIPSERVFSFAGLVKTNLRTRLTGEHLNRLVFLGTIKTKYWNLQVLI